MGMLSRAYMSMIGLFIVSQDDRDRSSLAFIQRPNFTAIPCNTDDHDCFVLHASNIRRLVCSSGGIVEDTYGCFVAHPSSQTCDRYRPRRNDRGSHCVARGRVRRPANRPSCLVDRKHTRRWFVCAARQPRQHDHARKEELACTGQVLAHREHAHGVALGSMHRATYHQTQPDTGGRALQDVPHRGTNDRSCIRHRGHTESQRQRAGRLVPDGSSREVIEQMVRADR